MTTPFIRLHPADDVVIARAQLLGGTPVEHVTSRGLIPPGHKVAMRAIAPGEPVRRYNQIIGFASKPIAAGEHVHTHNLDMGPDKGHFERDYAFGADVRETAYVEESKRATFQGFRRSNGKAGTRNYLGVLTTVNCSATVSRAIAAGSITSSSARPTPTRRPGPESWPLTWSATTRWKASG